MSIDHKRARQLEAARRAREMAMENPPDLEAARSVARELDADCTWPAALVIDQL
jgi:hypothetical protein